MRRRLPAPAVSAGEALSRTAPVTVKVRRVAGAPVVAVRVWLQGGARAEEVPGQAFVCSRMLNEGTESRDWRKLADDTEGRGMMLSSVATFEGHGLTLDALAQDWELAVEWAAEMALSSSFPEDRCGWVARQVAAELESLGDQPDTRTSWGFMEQLYTPHRRRRPVQGEIASLLSLNAADCARFHARSLLRGAIVAVAGEVEEEAVRARLESLFAGLALAPDRLPAPAVPLGLPGVRHEVKLEGGDQAHLYIGHLTVPRRDPDYTALEILAVILGSGAGLNGRIPARIREREGLAYTAQAQTVAGSSFDRGRLSVYIGTSPDTVAQAERGTFEELAELVASGVTEEEVDEARAYLLGREPFRRETARQWADLLVEAEHYSLPLDDPACRRSDLLACRREDVVAAARRHIDPSSLRVTVGLPA